MRSTPNAHSMIRFAATLCLALCASLASAEGWWPTGGDAKPENEPTEGEAAMVESQFFKLGWPKVQMPKFSWKSGAGETGAASSMSAEGNPISRTLDKVADSSRRAADNVRGAWGTTMSKLPFLGGGDSELNQVAKNDNKGFWSRMFGPQDPEPQGAQTVQQFLAQDRVGTTTR